jgi:hypothetical protein
LIRRLFEPQDAALQIKATAHSGKDVGAGD